jgi:hypothetical protein
MMVPAISRILKNEKLNGEYMENGEFLWHVHVNMYSTKVQCARTPPHIVREVCSLCEKERVHCKYCTCGDIHRARRASLSEHRRKMGDDCMFIVYPAKLLQNFGQILLDIISITDNSIN